MRARRMQNFPQAADVCGHDKAVTTIHVIQGRAEHGEVLGALHGAGFSEPWSSEEFAALLGQPGVAAWISESTEPTGFILVRAAADEAEILTLAVVPEQRKTGIGARLLETACEALRVSGTKQMFLEVSVKNAAAIALYKKFGFAQRGTRPAYYGGGGKDSEAADAIIMAKTL